jgi:hypothetical protein
VQDITNTGVMVGSAFDNTVDQFYPYVDTGSGPTLLPSGGLPGEATGVDSTGRISGNVEAAPRRAARWVGGVLTLFPDTTLVSDGRDIAPDGTVLVRRFGGGVGQLWHLDGTTTPIPSPVHADDLGVEAINTAHVVVGATRYTGSGYHAMLYDPGTGTSRLLNALVQPGSPWDLEGGMDVNDAGQVLAIGHANADPDLVRHALLLTPVSDSVAPAITITAPADGAQYLQGQVVTPLFNCVDNLDTSPTCTATSATVDTATAGSHTFTVNAHDAAGNPATKTVTYTVLAGSGTTNVSGSGGTLNTDTAGTGATDKVPVQTRLVIPPGVTGPCG